MLRFLCARLFLRRYEDAISFSIFRDYSFFRLMVLAFLFDLMYFIDADFLRHFDYFIFVSLIIFFRLRQSSLF